MNIGCSNTADDEEGDKGGESCTEEHCEVLSWMRSVADRTLALWWAMAPIGVCEDLYISVMLFVLIVLAKFLLSGGRFSNRFRCQSDLLMRLVPTSGMLELFITRCINRVEQFSLTNLSTLQPN